jgi:hypothetical protein
MTVLIILSSSALKFSGLFLRPSVFYMLCTFHFKCVRTVEIAARCLSVKLSMITQKACKAPSRIVLNSNEVDPP